MPGEERVARPSGVVSLLFTDVEGSTRLWAADADAMSASLQAHDKILRAAVESRGGYVFTTAGDSFAVAFSQASQAVDAAMAAQADLATTAWPGPELRVRMGLHLGEAEERGGDYFGPVVNACARVEAAGHGGQVLVTDALRSVLQRQDLHDLGEHQLRDLPAPMHLFQVGSGAFPPLRGVVGARDTLPARRTRLLGRDHELSRLQLLITDERLVTLVGPGGIGKTSLAIEAAGRLSAWFPGGAHFADLAQVSEPAGILPAMCRGIGLVVMTAPYDKLCDLLRSQPALVIVDNCEHLIDDTAEFVDRLLTDVPTLHVIATSREHLDLDGEHVVRVDPLPSGVGSAAVRLFIERVVALTPDFAPDADDLERISSICARLDGMPLAIELAAGRARAMGIAEIERGLDDRFALLAGGRRGKLRRQQTLRAAIDWSIELLSDKERDLLARLAVITGPFALDIAAAVNESSPATSAELVASLSAKSLVQRVDDVDGEARFQLLETVREWGLDDLTTRAMLRDVRDLHAHWYLTQAESPDPVEHVAASNWAADVGPVVDAMSAATHLRERDVIGAALILSRFGRGMVEAGLAPVAREIQRDARAEGWSRWPCRLWLSDALMVMDLAEGVPDDPPPADDGSFEWRFIVGGRGCDNGGLAGWYRAWFTPAEFLDDIRALPPVENDRQALAIRAYAMSNAVNAYTSLGHFEEAIAAFEESGQLWAQAGYPRASMGVELSSVETANVVQGRDLRDSHAAREVPRRAAASALWKLNKVVIGSAPNDRRLAVAKAAREDCDGRYPDDENNYLVLLAFYALADRDPAEVVSLVETVMGRSPGVVPLKRLTLLLARGEGIELMADQAHHQMALLEFNKTPEEIRAVSVLNRAKLDAEVARLLD